MLTIFCHISAVELVNSVKPFIVADSPSRLHWSYADATSAAEPEESTDLQSFPGDVAGRCRSFQVE